MTDDYKKAFAAQSRKLHAVLHIPGVKEALSELKSSFECAVPDGVKLDRYKPKCEGRSATMIMSADGEYAIHSEAAGIIAAQGVEIKLKCTDEVGYKSTIDHLVSRAEAAEAENEIYRKALEEISQEFMLTTSRMRLRNIAIAALDSAKNRKLQEC